MLPEFDAVAHEYDSTFSFTALGRLLRERVWFCTGGFSRRNPAAKAAGTVLELNCGTGEDAIWLAGQGWQVLATDISVEMLEVAWAKAELLSRKISISSQPNPTNLRFQACSFAEIEKLPVGDFDLIFSNFGGLNCVSPEDLSQLGPVLTQKLKPGGRFICVVMSRFCGWESLYFLLKMKPKVAFRRFGRKPVEARLDARTSVLTWYYSPREFQKHLQFKGQTVVVKPIGFWLPPSYLNPFFEKHPRLLGILNFLEQNFAPSWLAPAADHFFLCIERES
jgi:SAM-dependent methyltransferase